MDETRPRRAKSTLVKKLFEQRLSSYDLNSLTISISVSLSFVFLWNANENLHLFTSRSELRSHQRIWSSLIGKA